MKKLSDCIAEAGIQVDQVKRVDPAERLKAYHAAELARLDAEDRAARAARARQERERRLGRACIPEAYKDAVLGDFVPTSDSQKTALDVAKRFTHNYLTNVKPKGLGILMYGPVGVGKSHLACCILRELSDKYGLSVLYTTTQSLIRGVRRGWSRESGMTESDALEPYLNLDCLCIDEIGVQAGSESERNILFNVIDTRLSENRPTIFLSNIPPDELCDVLGDRIDDRIRGKCYPVRVIGKSQRKNVILSDFGDLP